MNLDYRVERAINFLLNECLPPVLRDSRWFMAPAYRILFKDKADEYLDFKERAPFMTDAEMRGFYAQIIRFSIQRQGTDLSRAALAEVFAGVCGDTVLDVGCGNGVLAGFLAERYRVTACDFVVGPDVTAQHPRVRFEEADLLHLPFPNDAFDTVTCTHTLEHVLDIRGALKELRRVARRRLIVVVPRERPYRYTFNLHLQFFPYRYMVVECMRLGAPGSSWDLKEVEGAWFYQEDLGLG
jgi:SAM-dependent methyltransferase